MPYHNYGTYKYEALNLYEYRHTFQVPSESDIEVVKELIRSVGVEVVDYK